MSLLPIAKYLSAYGAGNGYRKSNVMFLLGDRRTYVFLHNSLRHSRDVIEPTVSLGRIGEGLKTS